MYNYNVKLLIKCDKYFSVGIVLERKVILIVFELLYEIYYLKTVFFLRFLYVIVEFRGVLLVNWKVNIDNFFIYNIYNLIVIILKRKKSLSKLSL